MEKVSSAVEMVLPPGVFITTMPLWVAASTSTLSVPTPARPTTRSFGAASMRFFVTLVSERTIIAATSPTSGNSSDSGSRFSRTVTLNSGRCWSRAIPFGEMDSQINTFINRGRTVGQGPGQVKSTKPRAVSGSWRIQNGSADSRVRAFLASDQVRADKTVRAPVLLFLESAQDPDLAGSVGFRA